MIGLDKFISEYVTCRDVSMFQKDIERNKTELKITKDDIFMVWCW